MIIVGGAAAIIIVIVLILVLSVSHCSSCSGNGSAVQTSATEAATAATQPATQKPTEPPVKEIADNGKQGELDENSSLYFWDNKAFELFHSSDESAREYASAINKYKEDLGKDITVYDMVVPNHSEFGLCPREEQRLKTEQNVTSQRQNTTSIYKALSKDVKAVDIYDTLNEHKTEYLYFNTDNNWTGLGAYYAYTTFAKSAGLTPFQLASAEKNTIDGFLGSLYTASESSILKSNPDQVDYYTIPGNYDCRLFTLYDDGPLDVGMYYEGAEAGSSTYGVFCWGDNPLMMIDNVDNTSGQKIAVVKDSNGNAFAPYLAYNYDEVHIIDYRYFEGNLADYCKEHKINNVLFLNGIISANTDSQITAMNTLFEGSGAGDYDLDAQSTEDSTDAPDELYGDSGSDTDTDSGEDYGYDYSGESDSSSDSGEYSDGESGGGYGDVDGGEYGYEGENDYGGDGYDYSGGEYSY